MTTEPGRPWRLSWEPSDSHRVISVVGVSGLMVALALTIWGLPSFTTPSPTHQLGVMAPTCGGTRAAYFTMQGEFGEAWHYNPLGIVAVIASFGALVRVLIGAFTRRWLTLTIVWSRRRAWIVVAVAVVLLALLEVRQQMRAELLMAPWPT